MSIEERVRLLAPQYAENVEPDGWLLIHIDHIAAMVQKMLEDGVFALEAGK